MNYKLRKYNTPYLGVVELATYTGDGGKEIIALSSIRALFARIRAEKRLDDDGRLTYADEAAGHYTYTMRFTDGNGYRGGVGLGEAYRSDLKNADADEGIYYANPITCVYNRAYRNAALEFLGIPAYANAEVDDTFVPLGENSGFGWVFEDRPKDFPMPKTAAEWEKDGFPNFAKKPAAEDPLTPPTMTEAGLIPDPNAFIAAEAEPAAEKHLPDVSDGDPFAMNMIGGNTPNFDAEKTPFPEAVDIGGDLEPTAEAAESVEEMPSPIEAFAPNDPRQDPKYNAVITVGRLRGKKLSVREAFEDPANMDNLHWIADTMRPNSEGAKQIQILVREYFKLVEVK